MMNHTQGRANLIAWEHAKPDNFFTSDPNLQAVLRHYLGAQRYDDAYDTLNTLGAQSATLIDGYAHQEDKIGNHPRLERYSPLGERIEHIEFHPNHDLIGRMVWASGIMALQAEKGNTVQQMGLYYLLTMNGEAGHLCSLACTSGLIRALQTADASLREQYLPPLLDKDYDHKQHGAQFLTEVQGGSDVGANSIVATPDADGTWRISGEKWFCSNINAEQFLMTARANPADGTKGLGLFLVPRRLHDGTTNHFYIRRLKDKLGTRTLASAEVDFDGAIAYPVGVIENGFKTVVEEVLNTSRLMNAVACVGIMRRAYHEAAQYACHRVAFGQTLTTYPLVQEAIADLHSENLAGVASSFYIAHLVDSIDTGRANDDQKATYRLLVNVNKYITSIRATEMVHRAMEVLGGNGAIESFSVLPRLYRDLMVLESWEGTHNVLSLQVLRDMAKLGIHAGFGRVMHGLLAEIRHVSLQPLHTIVTQALDVTLNTASVLLKSDALYQQAHARRLVDRFALVAQATLLLHECQTTPDALKQDLVAYFINKHLVTGYDALADEAYLGRLERIALGV